MFRRENSESFGETEKLFRSKPSSQKGFGTRPEIFRGCRKCSGTFRNFSGENACEKHSVPGWGTRSPTNHGECFMEDAPFRGQPPFWWKGCWGAPHGGGHLPTNGGACFGEVGPPMWEPQRLAGQVWWGPPWGILPPLVG